MTKEFTCNNGGGARRWGQKRAWSTRRWGQKQAWSTPLLAPSCITGRHVAEGSNKVTFNTCDGFHDKEMCACPTLFVAVGATAGYMGILSTVLTSVYVFLAGWFDPVAPADGEEVVVKAEGNPDAVVISLSALEAPEEAGLGGVGVRSNGGDSDIDAATK